MAKEKLERSSRVARLAAYIIDIIILLPIILILRIFRIPLLGFFVAPGYNWIATSLYGQTLGKKLFGLKVVSNNNSKITWGQAFLREVIGKFASGIVIGLGFVWILFDEKRQGWHDKIAETQVFQITPLTGIKKVVAYVLAFIFPGLFLLLIFIAIIVAAINPSAQIQKAEKAKLLQQQQQFQIQQYNQIYPQQIPSR